MRGFTLIEVLVVIIIISIVSGVALVTLTANENRKLSSLTNEFVQRLTLAEEQALLQPAVLGLTLDNKGYHVGRYQSSVRKKPTWVPVSYSSLSEVSLPANVEFLLDKKTEKTEEGPQIIISSNGEITPFTLYVGIKGKRPRYLITGEADGHVSSQLLPPA